MGAFSPSYSSPLGILPVHHNAIPLPYNGHPHASLGLLYINPHYLGGNNIAVIDNILTFMTSSNNKYQNGGPPEEEVNTD